MSKNLSEILQFICSRSQVSYSELTQKFPDRAESTLVRNLTKLQNEAKILKIKNGRNTFYKAIRGSFLKEYLEQPFFERTKKGYNFEFLASYIPNKTSFLGEKYEIIKKEYVDKHILSTYDYKENIRVIENLLIDLSFSSSKLEGNTYSYLDTEILIKYNSSAE
jgi:hypothetical protein